MAHIVAVLVEECDVQRFPSERERRLETLVGQHVGELLVCSAVVSTLSGIVDWRELGDGPFLRK